MLKEYLSKNYYQEIESNTLMEGAIKGMFESVGDPYTVYMNEKEFSDLMTRAQGTYGGIGVIVTPGKDGFVTVVSPIEDTPGERAGLRTGDKITHVNGERVYAEKLDQAVEKMKGEPGTRVKLTIGREGEADPIEVEIKREEIRLKTVKSEVLENNIGYIRISMFDEKTAEDFKSHLSQLEDKGIKGLVLDLRNNPGGSLSQCVEIADVLLGDQIIVYTEDRDGHREIERSDKRGINYPLVLLVNKGSASASEILAGAVKDGGQGITIGTTTFGKGLVQHVKPLNDGTGFKYTVSQYFTPNGTNIHGTGVEPDIVVELPAELEDSLTIDRAKDTQLKRAIEEIKDKIKQ
jgi:carboxyl-terminal processing protease